MIPGERLDAFQRRHTWAGFPLATVYKYFDDQGSYLAALITYYGFLSLFPVLLLLASLLGFFLKNDHALQEKLIDSALGQFPVVGDSLGNPQSLQSSTTGTVLAFVVLLYGSMGVAQATQNAMNIAWGVPRNKRPNPLLSRLRSLLLLATSGLTLVASVVLSTLGSTPLFANGAVHTVLFNLLSIVLNAAILVLALRLATALPLTVRDVLPGALIGAVIWQVLQKFGTLYVDSVKGSSNTNGTFALVLGLMAWIFLLASSLVMCVEINVVRTRRLHPRSLLTPFTDDVDLTKADQRAYTQYANAQRAKGFESVEVTFDNDGQNATARRRKRRR